MKKNVYFWRQSPLLFFFTTTISDNKEQDVWGAHLLETRVVKLKESWRQSQQDGLQDMLLLEDELNLESLINDDKSIFKTCLFWALNLSSLVPWSDRYAPKHKDCDREKIAFTDKLLVFSSCRSLTIDWDGLTQWRDLQETVKDWTLQSSLIFLGTVSSSYSNRSMSLISRH